MFKIAAGGDSLSILIFDPKLFDPCELAELWFLLNTLSSLVSSLLPDMTRFISQTSLSFAENSLNTLRMIRQIMKC